MGHTSLISIKKEGEDEKEGGKIVSIANVMLPCLTSGTDE